jgi:hypothetical protein
MGKLLNIPAYRQAQYLLVLQPHEELRNRIISQKQALQQKYDIVTAPGKPHLTLAQFVTWQMSEERLSNRLHLLAMGFAPFKVILDGFGSLPTHSLTINVASKSAIQQLVRTLRPVQRLMKSTDSSPYFITDPYILLARKLLPWQYEKAWADYSHRHFTGSFIADGMLLLKRPLDSSAWQIVQRFSFMNLPVETKQGALFV